MMAIVFWVSVAIVFYTFFGYGILIFFILKLKRLFALCESNDKTECTNFPSCSVVIAAYNEENLIRQKIENTLSLYYPPELFEIIIVADGSSDETANIVSLFPQVRLMYTSERLGKVHAINRAMKDINSEIVVFTDANTFLNKEALVNIARHYSNEYVGAVAGEKRIFASEAADASSAGENMYWRYESQLKEWDSELNTAVGAAGELFSIRQRLYKHVPQAVILDDFIISMRIAEQGYKVVYEPEAYAIETASSTTAEELKRKVRIAAGGIQAIILLKSLLNPLNNPLLSFQYVSHRVLRWTLTPLLLIVILLSNLHLAYNLNDGFYTAVLLVQVSFYLLAFFGMIFERKKIRNKVFFVPYYFCIMNYAIIAGIFRYLKKQQSAVWDKAERKETPEALINE